MYKLTRDVRLVTHCEHIGVALGSKKGQGWWLEHKRRQVVRKTSPSCGLGPLRTKEKGETENKKQEKVPGNVVEDRKQ